MNFNKKVKGFFISSLTALVAVCGVAFGVTYKNAAVKADETNGKVIAASELSKDVRAVYDAFDVNPLISGNSSQSDYYGTFRNAYTVQYVQDATINNQKVSGLRFTVDINNLSGKRVTVIQPNLLKINTSSLSWNTPLFGFMMESRGIKKARDGFELGPTLIDENGHGFRLKVYESADSERSAIGAYVVNGASDKTVATDVNSTAGGTYVGGYYGARFVYAPSTRKWVGNNYVDTFAEEATAPFNFYYDNATNVAYCDASGNGSDTGWHLIRMFSEDPANYATHASPFTSEAGKSYGTGTGEATKFSGFKNNSARLGIRLIHGTDIGKYSFILTSYAGLDLTNPKNTFAATTNNYEVETENRTLAVKHGCVTSAVVGTNAKLPELNYVNRITGDVMSDECSATAVNVYKARRSSNMEYTAYGATVSAAELGTPIATGLTAGDNYTFTTPGDYTLEYVQGDKKLYFDYLVYTVSKDVDAIVNAINGSVDEYNAGSGSVSAEYVSNYNYNGVKLSGIKVTVSGASKPLYLPMLVKISDLTYKDNTLGYFMTPDVQGTNEIDGFNAYLVSADKKRAIAVEHSLDSGNADTAASPRTSTNIRVFENGLSSSGRYFGLYSDSSTYPFATRGIRGVSLNGYAKDPFNISYDARLNAMFGDISVSNGHPTGNITRFMRAFGVSPNDYTKYKDPTRNKNLKANGSGNYSPFTGLGEYAYIGFRPLLKSGVESASFVITSYAGVDLTNPSAKADNVISALKAENVYALNKEVNLPEIKTENRITGTENGGFDGSVTVYKGAREDKYVKYGSWGAGESLTFPVAGGGAVNGLTYLGVAENGVYTFTESGNYTLVYTSKSDETEIKGKTEIKEVYVSANTYTLKINAFNAKLTDEDGNILETGATVYSGQTVKVVPDKGYTLLNVGTLSSAGILIGDKATIDDKDEAVSGAYGNYRVLSNGSYVIQESDKSTFYNDDVIEIGIAAYKTKYNVKFYKNAPEDDTQGAGGVRLFEVYKDVPASYTVDGRLYCVYNPTVFKPTPTKGVACWNNNFGWDGKVLSLGTYNWTNEYDAASGDAYAKPQLFGYKVTYAAGSKQNSGLYKIGGEYNPIIDSDVTVEAALIRSFVDYTKAKIETNGTIGLSVKLCVSKPDYDRLARMLGTDTAFNMKAVITTGTVLDDLGADYKNAYGVTQGNQSGYVQDDINRKAVKTETYNGKEYYVYTVKGVNIPEENYAKDYVFGGYIKYGDQVVRFGQGGAEFEKINVYKAACMTFGEGGGNVTTDADAGYTNSRVINGLTYYSDTLDERGIYFAVKYYYVGMYLTYVTETEPEGSGYVSCKVNEKTYYYDQTKVNEVDIIRAIKFYHGVSLAEEV